VGVRFDNHLRIDRVDVAVVGPPNVASAFPCFRGWVSGFGCRVWGSGFRVES